MSRTGSPSSKKPYGVARLRALWAELVTAIRQLLDQAVFNGEGYRKIWARLRHQGIRTSVYISDDFQNEIRFLGIEPSPAFVRQPEGNGMYRALLSHPQRTVTLDPP